MAGRPHPALSLDTAFSWDGLRAHRLLIQKCQDCGALRHPPRPTCPSCCSFDWTAIEASGRGIVYSYAIPHHPEFPFMPDPYVVVLVELEEGIRLVSNLCEIATDDVRVGMNVEVFYAHLEDDLVLHQFRPALDH